MTRFLSPLCGDFVLANQLEEDRGTTDESHSSGRRSPMMQARFAQGSAHVSELASTKTGDENARDLDGIRQGVIGTWPRRHVLITAKTTRHSSHRWGVRLTSGSWPAGMIRRPALGTYLSLIRRSLAGRSIELLGA
jgi:hypothetical protein